MRKPVSVVQPNVASTEQLGTIIDELSAMRLQLSSLEASVGSVKNDLGFVRDRMGMQHEVLSARIMPQEPSSISSISPVTNLVSMPPSPTAPLMRRATGIEASLSRPTFSHAGTGATGATGSVGLGTLLHSAAADVNRVSTLTCMAKEEVRKILECNNQQITLAKEKSMRAHSRLGSFGNKWTTRASQSPILVKSVKLLYGGDEDGQHFENIMDSVVGFVIVLNAIFLGLVSDASDSEKGAWLACDITFSVIFWLELIIKVSVKGWRSQYCGHHSFSNIFDALLIFIDTIQLFLLFAGDLIENDSIQESSGVASLFRIVRLMRLARILRLLRSRVFQDLLAMIQGMLGGLATLGWSVVLFVLFIYVVSLIFRLYLGPDKRISSEDELAMEVQTYFADVPRSMFTMFRCSFGDCTTDGGTPIFEHVTEVHGGIWAFMYGAFNFMVVIGLFNVISAIFVESTLAAAAKLQVSKLKKRLDDEKRWAVNFVILLRALLVGTHGHNGAIDRLTEGRCSMNMTNDILKAEFKRENFDAVLREDQSARHALIELDIDPQDHKYLSDILDPDNGGTIGVLELVDGLKRLRGEPRRSDIISIDLMVRSLQEKVDDIWRGIGCDQATASCKLQVPEAPVMSPGSLASHDSRTSLRSQAQQSCWQSTLVGPRNGGQGTDSI